MLFQNRDRKLIAAIHDYQRHRDGHGLVARVRCNWAKLRHGFWSALTGSEIHRDATIAASVSFPHLTGVVIHEDAEIEEGCMIMQQVTLGQTAVPGAPVVARGAYIGAGAKVLGGVRIGQNSRIGANSVVLLDVPDNSTVVGVPARIVSQRPGSGPTP